MDRLRKNARSTKLRAAIEYVDDPPPKQENKTNAGFVALGVTETDGTVYTNLTGKFPIASNNGSQYMLVTYDYNSNAVLARLLKSRNNSDMLD
eukprot:10643371-Ditylum_brightwellii.AAC.1